MSGAPFERHARNVASLTVVSRVLGLARDALFSRVFGDASAMSAFFTAFIIPNVFRRLFGEGALSAAFIPEYATLVERDPSLAQRFASLTVAMLIAALGALTLLIMGALAALRWLTPLGESGAMVLELAMVMLPFMPLVCLTAIAGGMLQTHGRFAPHAGAPIGLNLCMIAGATVWGVALGRDASQSVRAVSVSVVIAGLVQLAWALYALRAHVRWTRARDGARDAVMRMLRRLGPVIIGMGALQLGTLADALIAGWPVIVGTRVPGIDRPYPLDESSASRIYYAQRLYQFPLGVFGVAIATAVFPVLSRESGDGARFARTLRRGLRLCLFLGVPASVGLILVRETLTRTLYAGGEFGAAETEAVARIVAGYGLSVWAYMTVLLLTRAFYARGDMSIPMRTGLATLAINIALSVTLIWWVGELGIALSTAFGAIAQCVALIVIARTRLVAGALFDPSTTRAAVETLLMAIVMGACVAAIDGAWSIHPETGTWAESALKLGVMTCSGGVVYLGLALARRREELLWLVRRDYPTD